MALLEMYAVYDKAVQAFSRPMFVRARGEALRSFMDECGNEKSELWKHSSDYSLFYLGTFDELSGVVDPPIAGAELIINAFEVAAKKEKGGI